MNLKYLSSLIFIAIISSGCNPSTVKLEAETSQPEIDPITWDSCGYNINDHMCNFSLMDQDGDIFDLYDHIGKPIILDYSTMWCGYCQVAAQDVTNIQSIHSDSELLYVSVLIENTSGSPPTVADCDSWSSIFGIVDSPVLAGSRELIDANGKSGAPVTAWPTFLFLDEEMIIKDVLRGYSKESLDYKLQGLLAD